MCARIWRKLTNKFALMKKINAILRRRNFPLRTVEELRRLGHDVLTTYEDGRANRAIPDKEVLRRGDGTKSRNFDSQPRRL